MAYFYGFLIGAFVMLICAVIYNIRSGIAKNRADEHSAAGADSIIERADSEGQSITKRANTIVEEASAAGESVQDIIDAIRRRGAVNDSGSSGGETVTGEETE